MMKKDIQYFINKFLAIGQEMQQANLSDAEIIMAISAISCKGIQLTSNPNLLLPVFLGIMQGATQTEHEYSISN